MQKIYLIAICLFFWSLSFCQTSERYRDSEGNKVVKGFLSRKDFITDSSFSWFLKNQQGYVPDSATVSAIRANNQNIHFIAFGGTWCDDTKFILPKFFVLADASGLSEEMITVIGVDHKKKTIEHLSEIFNITNVPTIIVFKNGKEIGRVVEFGKHGMFDQDLGEIVGGLAK
ncbi:MAG: hypothetical protein NVS1B13_05150 [Flavisolibacter sp.]